MLNLQINIANRTNDFRITDCFEWDREREREEKKERNVLKI